MGERKGREEMGGSGVKGLVERGKKGGGKEWRERVTAGRGAVKREKEKDKRESGKVVKWLR